MSNRQFVIIVIITFVVVAIWIVADILHTKPSVPVNPKLNSLLTPISPNFDQKVISQIKDVIPMDEMQPEIITPSPTPIATPPPVPISSESASLTEGGIP